LKAQAAPLSLQEWDGIFSAKAEELYPPSDPSHDFLHIRRVVRMACALAAEEAADMSVVLPAAYFHDFVNVPKDDPRRKQASRLSAEAAAEYLLSIGYPAAYIDGIRHAIAAHSFSAGIAPETLEAKVVQDADRLDALGAIGIARCFSTAALMQRPYYCAADPWAESREPNDKDFSLDHFEAKLFRLGETMHTKAARAEAERRINFMRAYLSQLKKELY
jgi:uncharacterized protein